MFWGSFGWGNFNSGEVLVGTFFLGEVLILGKFLLGKFFWGRFCWGNFGWGSSLGEVLTCNPYKTLEATTASPLIVWKMGPGETPHYAKHMYL